MDNDQSYLLAKRRVKSIKGFYLHVSIFVVVMAFLVILNALTGGHWWVQWALLGWGIGLVAHAVAVFGIAGWLDADWEERKIKEIMAKDGKNGRGA
ncbi:MAG: 2TM domain-containing protein [Xanthobacteraceae bacterium]|jgi:hypothetical protein